MPTTDEENDKDAEYNDDEADDGKNTLMWKMLMEEQGDEDKKMLGTKALRDYVGNDDEEDDDEEDDDGEDDDEENDDDDDEKPNS